MAPSSHEHFGDTNYAIYQETSLILWMNTHKQVRSTCWLNKCICVTMQTRLPSMSEMRLKALNENPKKFSDKFYYVKFMTCNLLLRVLICFLSDKCLYEVWKCEWWQVFGLKSRHLELCSQVPSFESQLWLLISEADLGDHRDGTSDWAPGTHAGGGTEFLAPHVRPQPSLSHWGLLGRHRTDESSSMHHSFHFSLSKSQQSMDEWMPC